MNSWLKCGPFNANQVDKFLARFNFQVDIGDPDGDQIFFGASHDGVSFQGIAWNGSSNNTWIDLSIYINGLGGDDTVWVAWAFTSDEDGENIGQGAWLDDLEVWRYFTPSAKCAELDAGNKGVVGDISPYDTATLNAIVNTTAKWMRMNIVRSEDGYLDLQKYDMMVDNLCLHNISVLGLITHQALNRQDYNDEATAASYRYDYANLAAFLAKYYEGRIKYWEIWNEPNASSIDPALYAPLLTESYQAIKAINPTAQILFGGLGSAWDDSRDYLEAVYNALGNARPFDYLAIHPYPKASTDPINYLHSDIGYQTIIDKFLETMFNHGDNNKKIWITEIGWNSTADNDPEPWCKTQLLVTEPQQALYLKQGFDILFNEVHLWNDPNTPAIEKIIWYQYIDIGILYTCAPIQEKSIGGLAFITVIYFLNKLCAVLLLTPQLVMP